MRLCGRPKSSGKKKPGPKPGSGKKKEKAEKPAKKQKTSAAASGSQTHGGSRGGAGRPSSAASAAGSGATSAGYSAFVAEYGTTLKQVDANLVEEGGGQSDTLAAMWANLEPKARAQYEKAALASRVEKIARVNYMKRESPRVQKESGGDPTQNVQQILDGQWTALPAGKREPLLAEARREEHGESGFKLYSEEYESSLDDAALGIVETGGGDEHVLRTMWSELDTAKQDEYIGDAIKNAEKAAVGDALASPKKKQKARRPRTPSSKSKPKSLSKQYIQASCEACVALKERNGSTAM